MKLRCGACFAQPGWKGRLLGRVEPSTGRFLGSESDAGPGDQPNVVPMLRAAGRISTVGGRHRVSCHPRRCGAVFVLSVADLARAAQAAAGEGRDELVAGVDVGRRVTRG